MREYEIRVLKADRSTEAVFEVMQLTDGPAITAGKKFAQGRPFEVWRGPECVYYTRAKVPLKGTP